MVTPRCQAFVTPVCLRIYEQHVSRPSRISALFSFWGAPKSRVEFDLYVGIVVYWQNKNHDNSPLYDQEMKS